MSKNKALWNSQENAKAYDSYARTFPMYMTTSQDMISLVQIKDGMNVLDLAAGTTPRQKNIRDRSLNGISALTI